VRFNHLEMFEQAPFATEKTRVRGFFARILKKPIFLVTTITCLTTMTSNQAEKETTMFPSTTTSTVEGAYSIFVSDHC
jgi:hypothetical protein